MTPPELQAVAQIAYCQSLWRGLKLEVDGEHGAWAFARSFRSATRRASKVPHQWSIIDATCIHRTSNPFLDNQSRHHINLVRLTAFTGALSHGLRQMPKGVEEDGACHTRREEEERALLWFSSWRQDQVIVHRGEQWHWQGKYSPPLPHTLPS